MTAQLMQLRFPSVLLLAATLLWGACGSFGPTAQHDDARAGDTAASDASGGPGEVPVTFPDSSAGADSGADADSSAGADSSADADNTSADQGAASDTTTDDDQAVPAGRSLCAAAPPQGARVAPEPRSYSEGTCPTLKAGRNVLRSDGSTREFLLFLPRDPGPEERLPVLFIWHWLNASADSVEDRVDLQTAVNTQRFIAVVPESKGDDLLTAGMPWPFLRLVPSGRMREEFRFFDDMLACVSAGYSVNNECVATMGVSAGALFTAQLAAERSEYLSSFVSISGGVRSSGSLSLGGLTNPTLRDWGGASHKLPALVLWGGPDDQCVLLDFDEASEQMEDDLVDDGHFLVECEHNCKHAIWVDEPAESDFQPLWDFFLDHPYWLAAGDSPYLDSNTLPSTYPPWCAIGARNAVRRQGPCPAPSCPL